MELSYRNRSCAVLSLLILLFSNFSLAQTAICPRLEGMGFLDCSTVGSCTGQCSDNSANYASCKKFRTCGNLCQGTRPPKCDPSLAGNTYECHKYANECGEAACQGTKPDACPPDAAERPDCEDVYTYCGRICRPAKIKDSCQEAWARAGKTPENTLICESVTTKCDVVCPGQKIPKKCDDPSIQTQLNNLSCKESMDLECGIRCGGRKPPECPGKCPTPPETCPEVCLEREPVVPGKCVDLPEGGQHCEEGTGGGCKRYGKDPNCREKPGGMEDNYPIGCGCACTPQ